MVLSVDPVDESILDEARAGGLRIIELEVAGPVTVEVSRA